MESDPVWKTGEADEKKKVRRRCRRGYVLGKVYINSLFGIVVRMLEANDYEIWRVGSADLCKD